MKSLTLLLLVVLIYCAVSEASKRPRCPRACHRAYKPVCAKWTRGGRTSKCTFANSCILENARCQHKQDWRVYVQEACHTTTRDCKALTRM